MFSRQVMIAYLWAFVWGSALPLGSLAFLMIHHVTGGRWSEPLAPYARRASAATPALILLFLPIAFQLTTLYPWASPDTLASEPLWQHRAAYMNPTGFTLRSLAALFVWSFLSWKMQDTQSTPGLQKTASVGLALHMFLTGMVSVDWLMSLELHFSSTVYGLLLMLLQAFTAFALLTAASCLRPAQKAEEPDSGSFYDLGGLMLAQVMLVGYLSFSQIVIMWSGDMPGEIGWVLPRMWGAWKWWGLGLLVFQLFMPFLCLVWGSIKRDRRSLAAVTSTVVLLSPVHFYWLIVPSFYPDRVVVLWPCLVGLVVVAALWAACLRLPTEDEVPDEI